MSALKLEPAQYACLQIILQTFFPSFSDAEARVAISQSKLPFSQARLDYFRATIDAREMDSILTRIPKLLKAAQIWQVKTVVDLLCTSFGTFALSNGAHFVPFTTLSLSEREAVFARWATSYITAKRTLFRLFFHLASLAFFGTLDETGLVNAHCHALGYPGPLKSEERPAVRPLECPFTFLQHDSFTSENDYDVVIVGSGAGGGVMAAELSRAGYRVLVVEKGSFKRGENLSMVEIEAFDSMFEAGGMVPSDNGSITVFAGSTFGGGTSVNWSACLRTPHDVRKEWAEKHGLTHFMSAKFQESLDKVCTRIGVTTANLKHNPANQVILDGAKILGYPVEEVPQNTAGDEHYCGYCTLGCPSGTKRGTMETYLQDAAKHGAKFLCDAHVDTIVRDSSGKVKGVLTKFLKDGKDAQVLINAKIVVLSAGSLHSPAILLRSGFKNHNIGRNLRLHPVSLTVAIYDRPMNPFEGTIISTLCTVAENMDGEHHGARIEVPSSHPMLASVCVPFLDVEDQEFPENFTAPKALIYRQTMLKFRHMAGAIVLQSDADSVGQVTLDSDGKPTVSFTLGPKDAVSLLNGIEKAMDMQLVAGAKEIITGIGGCSRFVVEENDVTNPKYREFMKRIRQAGVNPPHNTSLSSAHQMGTCRLSTNSRDGVCKPTGQLWECDQVWVCDGSVFPTSSGVNPMVTILACADGIAQECRAWMDTQKFC